MAALPQTGDLIGDKYEVVRVLGQGGMGAVFEGVHRLTGKRFAIKWMLPSLTDSADAVKRFIREAQVAGRVEHPNIVEVYDLGRQEGACYMVMELLQGETLRELLERRERLEALAVCDIVMPVLRGLAAAHSAGVIHRDLKPDNIFLVNGSEGGTIPKVLDFGISKLASATGQVTVGLTRHGQVMGTPHYMPSEQLRGEKIDPRADLYAIGVIMYQALAGVLPFRNEGFGDLVIEIATRAPTPLQQAAPGTPAEFCRIVEKAMARDADDRFADAAEFLAAIAAYTGLPTTPPPALGAITPRSGFDTVALPATPPAGTMATPLVAESTLRPRPASSQFPWLLAAAGGVFAVAAIGLAIALYQASDEPSWAAATAAEVDESEGPERKLAGRPAEAIEDEGLIPLDAPTEAAEETAEAPAPQEPSVPTEEPERAHEAPSPDEQADSTRDAQARRAARARRRREARRARPPNRRERESPPAPSLPVVAETPTAPVSTDPPKPTARPTRSASGRTNVDLTPDDF